MEWLTRADLINECFPIVELEIYGNGAFRVIRKAKKKLQQKPTCRGEITKMTRQSLRNLMFTMQTTPVRFGSMLTLTYPKLFPNDGEAVKGDLNFLLQRVRRLKMLYLWFLEFQGRGAPHIHILLDANAISPYFRVNFGLAWAERVATSEIFVNQCPPERYDREVVKMVKVNLHHRTWELLRSEHSARNYVMKYASKEDQKKVPKRYMSVGRFWGCSQKVRAEPKRTIDVTEDDLRALLMRAEHQAANYAVLPRQLWSVQSGDPDLTISERDA